MERIQKILLGDFEVLEREPTPEIIAVAVAVEFAKGESSDKRRIGEKILDHLKGKENLFLATCELVPFLIDYIPEKYVIDNIMDNLEPRLYSHCHVIDKVKSYCPIWDTIREMDPEQIKEIAIDQARIFIKSESGLKQLESFYGKRSHVNISAVALIDAVHNTASKMPDKMKIQLWTNNLSSESNKLYGYIYNIVTGHYKLICTLDEMLRQMDYKDFCRIAENTTNPVYDHFVTSDGESIPVMEIIWFK